MKPIPITDLHRAQIADILIDAAQNVTHHTHEKKHIYKILLPGDIRIGFAIEILKQGQCRKLMVGKPSFWRSGIPSNDECNQIIELFGYAGTIEHCIVERHDGYLIIIQPM